VVCVVLVCDVDDLALACQIALMESGDLSEESWSVLSQVSGMEQSSKAPSDLWRMEDRDAALQLCDKGLLSLVPGDGHPKRVLVKMASEPIRVECKRLLEQREENE
jgi:hypothetical protein